MACTCGAFVHVDLCVLVCLSMCVCVCKCVCASFFAGPFAPEAMPGNGWLAVTGYQPQSNGILTSPTGTWSVPFITTAEACRQRTRLTGFISYVHDPVAQLVRYSTLPCLCCYVYLEALSAHAYA